MSTGRKATKQIETNASERVASSAPNEIRNEASVAQSEEDHEPEGEKMELSYIPKPSSDKKEMLLDDFCHFAGSKKSLYDALTYQGKDILELTLRYRPDIPSPRDYDHCRLPRGHPEGKEEGVPHGRGPAISPPTQSILNEEAIGRDDCEE